MISYPEKPVLIVDDEKASLQSFSLVLKKNGITNITAVSDATKVAELLNKNNYELVLLDLIMPHISGLDLLDLIHSEYPDLPVIIITSVDDVKTAVSCMQKEASDYLVKPIEPSRLVSSVKRTIELRKLQKENMLLKEQFLSKSLSHPEHFSNIVTQSPLMTRLFRYVEAISASNEAVLIEGETGSGKELFAEAIHVASKRRGLFVPVNVAGLDDTMFSDTLFGHFTGAFTGATDKRKGLIERAAGGTLFLDEIGDLSENLQVKLLRLLQSGEYRPLGTDSTKKSDTRMVLATNVNLTDKMQAGKFRKDLYYRINTHLIRIPPLRERMEDIPALVDHFVSIGCEKLNKSHIKTDPKIYAQLNRHTFPGNVRELESIIYNAVATCQGDTLTLKELRTLAVALPDVTVQDLSDYRSSSIVLPTILPTLKEMDQILVKEAMKRSDDNQSEAAKMLGISRQALNKRWIKMSERSRE